MSAQTRSHSANLELGNLLGDLVYQADPILVGLTETEDPARAYVDPGVTDCGDRFQSLVI